MLFLFYCQNQRRTIKMQSMNIPRIFHSALTLQVLLLLFSHFIPGAQCNSVTWSQPSSVRGSDVPQVLREHRGQIDIIRQTNHKLELKNFTSRSDMSSDINNNNISKSNYINHDPITNRKIDGHRHRLATSTKQTDPFVLPSPTSTSTSDSVANKSFRPSKLPTETATSNLSEISPYTDARINGLYIDRAIICDCSINDTPISSGKRRQEPSPWCLQQCLSAKHRNRRNNIEQFPDKSFRLSSANSTRPNDMANQQHQWHTRPTPNTERTFTGLSSSHKQRQQQQLYAIRVLKNANRLNGIGERDIHNDIRDDNQDDDDVANAEHSTAGGARHLNDTGNFHNDSYVDMFENDSNESVSRENSTHSINVRQMHNAVNVQQQIRQPHKRHQNHEENAPDDEGEYFIALNSDALRMDIGSSGAGRDDSARRTRSDEETNPMNTSAAYSDNAVGDDMCLDSNNSACYRGDVDNITCVGDPAYCNYTYDEYVQMLHDYITPTVPEWILICSHAIVFFIGLIGNALVCIAVYTNYTMRTVTNIFIVNLAVADFFVILFCLPPTVVWDVTETWFMGEVMCKVVLYFQTVSVTVSVLTLTFISIDRWYAICFPLRYVSTNQRAIGSIAFIWMVALLSDIPEFLISTTKRKELRFEIDLFTQCVSTWDKETEKNFYIARFIMLYLLPLVLMTIAYFQIVRVLWKSDTIPGHRESRNQTYICGYLRSGPSANSSTMGQLRARRKAAKMLVAVVIMFASCFFPVHVLNILRYTIDIGQSDIVTVLSLFSHWLCYANSAINPVIYNFMSGKFRREFRNVLEKCRCGQRRIEDRSFFLNAPVTRVNNVSPNSRSNYHMTSVRDINSYRERHTMQTSFVENGCDACTGNVVDGTGVGVGSVGGAADYAAINTNNLRCPTGSNNSAGAILSNRRCSGVNNKRNNKQ